MGGVSELAKKIGKSPSYVTKRIARLNLRDDIIQSIEDLRVPPSIADELHSIKDQAKQSELAFLITQRRLSLRRARELVDQVNQDEWVLEKRSYYED